MGPDIHTVSRYGKGKMARSCLWCCAIQNQVHPLENILDVRTQSDVGLEMATTEEESETTDVEPLGVISRGKKVKTVPQMETTRSNFGANGQREQEEITPMHAAAVNGDRSSLTKLLSSGALDLNAGDKFGRTPLMYCILGDRMECADMLLKSSADVNSKDIGGRTALHWAAHKGNFRGLKKLLSKGANWKEKDNQGQTAMHLSTRHKSPKCLALLMKQLELGEVDDQDKNKRTALHWAASYGNLEHVKMLIKQDSNIGIPDVEGKTPLHWAACSMDPEAADCVRLILEIAPSVINWQDYEGRTALHLAVADGNEAIVIALTYLEKCNVSALDNMFRTPLHWGAVLGHSKIMGMLLEKKADWASSDSNGATPLHYAAQNNFADTVEVLLAWPEVKDEPDIEGRTAFMWAAGKGADDVIKTFIRCGVDMLQTDKNGGTALHAAAMVGHTSTVKLLLDHGAVIDYTDVLKHSPLFRACEMGQTAVVQTLIDYGSKVDTLDQDGRSPLHWAALGGHASICQILIKFGIDPNIRDHSGRTPLLCAAYGGYVNCMSVLIENSANSNSQDNQGMTALHWACNKGHLDTVKLLIEFHSFPNHMEFTEDRYTPLDYALMGEHYEVAQYMIEQGALSITGIQDIAAIRIQAIFRGYRVRKTFLERKRLLMKHEQLRKGAAKKKAEEESRRKKDIRYKKQAEENLHLSRKKGLSGDFVVTHEDRESEADTPENMAEQDKVNAMDRNSYSSDFASESSCSDGTTGPEHTISRDNEEKKEEQKSSIGQAADENHSDHVSSDKEDKNDKQSEEGSTKNTQATNREKKVVEKNEITNPETSIKKQDKETSKRLRQRSEEGGLDQVSVGEDNVFETESPSTAADTRDVEKGSKQKNKNGAGNEVQVESKTTDKKVRNRDNAKKVYNTTSKETVHGDNSQNNGSVSRDKRSDSDQNSDSTYNSRTEGNNRGSDGEPAANKEHPTENKEEDRQKKKPESQKRLLAQQRTKSAGRSRVREVKIGRPQPGHKQWEQRQAAADVQLAWKNYYRERIQKSATARRKSGKQRDLASSQTATVQHLYTKKQNVSDWNPKHENVERPDWLTAIPSAVSVSYNFACTSYKEQHGGRRRGSASSQNNTNTTQVEEYGQLRSSDGRQPQQFSYNLS